MFAVVDLVTVPDHADHIEVDELISACVDNRENDHDDVHNFDRMRKIQPRSCAKMQQLSDKGNPIENVATLVRQCDHAAGLLYASLAGQLCASRHLSMSTTLCNMQPRGHDSNWVVRKPASRQPRHALMRLSDVELQTDAEIHLHGRSVPAPLPGTRRRGLWWHGRGSLSRGRSRHNDTTPRNPY